MMSQDKNNQKYNVTRRTVLSTGITTSLIGLSGVSSGLDTVGKNSEKGTVDTQENHLKIEPRSESQQLNYIAKELNKENSRGIIEYEKRDGEIYIKEPESVPITNSYGPIAPCSNDNLVAPLCGGGGGPCGVSSLEFESTGKLTMDITLKLDEEDARIIADVVGRTGKIGTITNHVNKVVTLYNLPGWAVGLVALGLRGLADAIRKHNDGCGVEVEFEVHKAFGLQDIEPSSQP